MRRLMRRLQRLQRRQGAAEAEKPFLREGERKEKSREEEEEQRGKRRGDRRKKRRDERRGGRRGGSAAGAVHRAGLISDVVRPAGLGRSHDRRVPPADPGPQLGHALLQEHDDADTSIHAGVRRVSGKHSCARRRFSAEMQTT